MERRKYAVPDIVGGEAEGEIGFLEAVWSEEESPSDAQSADSEAPVGGTVAAISQELPGMVSLESEERMGQGGFWF